MSVTDGSPLVSVPVLSKHRVVVLRALSTYSPLRSSRPSSAPLPTPASIAVGVAMPKAQGQAIKSTASKTKKAAEKPLVMYQKLNETAATVKIIGTNLATIRSANFWTGALDA